VLLNHRSVLINSTDFRGKGAGRSSNPNADPNRERGRGLMPRHLLTAKQIIAAADCDLADGDGRIRQPGGRVGHLRALAFQRP
jgi:hypothetical protein